MNRRGDRTFLDALFAKLRDRIPGLILRTSVITGLPGEGEAEFEELCLFLKDMFWEKLRGGLLAVAVTVAAFAFLYPSDFAKRFLFLFGGLLLILIFSPDRENLQIPVLQHRVEILGFKHTFEMAAQKNRVKQMRFQKTSAVVTHGRKDIGIDEKALALAEGKCLIGRRYLNCALPDIAEFHSLMPMPRHSCGFHIHCVECIGVGALQILDLFHPVVADLQLHNASILS